MNTKIWCMRIFAVCISTSGYLDTFGVDSISVAGAYSWRMNTTCMSSHTAVKEQTFDGQLAGGVDLRPC